MAEEIEAFYEALRQDVRLEADNEGAQGMRPEAFTSIVIETLIEAGEIEDAVPCFMQQRGIEVHGYGIEDDNTLNLITTIYSGDSEPSTVRKSDVKTAAKRLIGFWRRCQNQDEPLQDELEESSESFDMALHIGSRISSIERIRLFVITDGSVMLERIEVPDDLGVEVRSGIWDLDRLFRLDSSGQAREPIEIDFRSRFGESLRCLTPGEHGDSKLYSLLAIVPGEWLADVYDEYGARLLELNVRSFLQATGKVNRGIRDTIRDEPERFLAYNNGISATASEAVLETAPDGQSSIRALKDLQIVNGGQTTASVHRAKVTGTDLSSVDVQMKVSIVPPEQLEAVVPSISRYANSQNKVSNADLSSNDPFHVELEELSRVVWTPAQEDSLVQTKWFYERARGQYRNEVANRRTVAQRKRWQAEFPKTQCINKTDLAKFQNSWEQLPQIVARGAQKNFTVFMGELAKTKRKPDEAYFRKSVALAILWKSTYRIALNQYPSYRPNITSFAVAKLSHSTSMRVDLGRIWDSQEIGEALEEAMASLCAISWRVLVDEAPEGMNVGEWAKKDGAWKEMKGANWRVPESVDQSLVTLRGQAKSEFQGSSAVADDPNIVECVALGADAWFAMSNWARETSNLAPWQRQLAYGLGRRISNGNPPTARQALQGKRILDEARRLGFAP